MITSKSIVAESQLGPSHILVIDGITGESSEFLLPDFCREFNKYQRESRNKVNKVVNNIIETLNDFHIGGQNGN